MAWLCISQINADFAKLLLMGTGSRDPIAPLKVTPPPQIPNTDFYVSGGFTISLSLRVRWWQQCLGVYWLILGPLIPSQDSNNVPTTETLTSSMAKELATDVIGKKPYRSVQQKHRQVNLRIEVYNRLI